MAESQLSTRSSTQQKARVLVVDDSRVIRKAIEKVLGSDFDLVEAGDGEEGWEALTNDDRMSVVISDIQMPVLDGYGMICRIRAADDPKVRDVPVIVITGAEDETTKERAYACGANDFILKPIDSQQLLGCVQGHANAQTHAAKLQQTQAAMSRHAEAFEEAVMEAPDIDTALQILAGTKNGSVEPYALDLAYKALPLLEFCNRKFGLELDIEIAAIKERLAGLQ